MDELFELVDPESAQRFLAEKPLEVRRQGLRLYNRSRVRGLAADEPGMAYRAEVLDSVTQSIRLFYDEIGSWEGGCTCGQRDCEHVVAGMYALLTENRAATVSGLSAGRPAALAALATKAAAGSGGSELARRLVAGVGRRLTREEAAFVRKVHSAYLGCQQRQGVIGPWDFQQMGLPLPRAAACITTAEVWPRFPDSDYEFWLYAARTVKQFGGQIPEFMFPVTDLTAVDALMAKWLRIQSVRNWKQTLENLEIDGGADIPARDLELDLRVCIDRHEVRLQWRLEDKGEFEELKASHVRQIQSEYDAGRVRMPVPAELLWRLFSTTVMYQGTWRLSYSGMSAGPTLNRILRIPELESRIVNPAGKVLARPAQPLRWDLVRSSAPEDYVLRLVRAEGSPAPCWLCVLRGRPTLYLAPDEIYTGPPPMVHVLKTDSENRIPAAALESSAGVAFLKQLGVPPPPEIAARIRTLPYEVGIHCRLKPACPGSSIENCVIRVQAETEDGHRLVWWGNHWREDMPGPKHRRPSREDQLVVYDRTALDRVPPMDSLNPRPDYNGDLVVRVARKFPELFSAWIKTVPPTIKLVLEGELASFLSTDVAGKLKLDIAEAEIDWFDLRVVLDVSDTTLTREELNLLLNARGTYVRLKGKGWRRLQFDLSSEDDDRLAQLGLSLRELSAEPQRLHALQLADDAARQFMPELQVERIQRRASEIKARVLPDLPAGVTAQLRPYQLEGFHFLAYLSTNRFGGILADDMGLGKTLQTLAWLVWLRAQEPNAGASADAADVGNVSATGPSLVVCPKSVMDNWHAEAARFTPVLRVRPWSAGELARLPKELDTADLHVLNYSQLRTLGESLLPMRWFALILDEGQYIKNPNSQTAQVARALRAGHRLVLSGTPIENRLMDLWSLMAFAMPGVLGSRAQFAKLYDAKGDPFARRRLAARVRPFVLRRTKAQVAPDLPDRAEEDLFCEIEGEQKMLYRAELKRAQQMLLRIKTQKELAQQQFHFLTSLLRLRQICCHPRLVKPDSRAGSAKVEALVEQLEPLMDEGQKVLVFSQFVELLEVLKPVVETHKWPYFYLAGQTENRGELVRNFQEAEGPAVFLISLKAGGFGLNLTAASYVVLFDPWWNPAVENQAIDRTHRIGQTQKVMAYRLLIKDSIEEKIRELQRQKKALAEDVLGEERFSQNLTLDDLKFLFAD